jgi:hypothetical protein
LNSLCGWGVGTSMMGVISRGLGSGCRWLGLGVRNNLFLNEV